MARILDPLLASLEFSLMVVLKTDHLSPTTDHAGESNLDPDGVRIGVSILVGVYAAVSTLVGVYTGVSSLVGVCPYGADADDLNDEAC